MHSPIKKLAFVITLTILSGCAALQNAPSPKTEPPNPEKVTQPEEITKPLPPLLSGGTKPLLTEELIGKVDFPPDPEDEISPCIDPKTGKEKNFLLADLLSELIPLSYTDMDQILSSLQVMGLKTIEATGPISKPYTVDRKGKAKMLPVPKLTHDKIGYACSELPVFYKPKLVPVKSLTEIMAGPSQSKSGSRFSMVNLNPANFGLNESMIVFYHPSGKKRLDSIKKIIDKT
ncbi:MAG: hypothetical protein ABGX43_06680, partial [Nitrospinaceae bacterium]